jgi:hypothetical protein
MTESLTASVPYWHTCITFFQLPEEHEYWLSISGTPCHNRYVPDLHWTVVQRFPDIPELAEMDNALRLSALLALHGDLIEHLIDERALLTSIISANGGRQKWSWYEL